MSLFIIFLISLMIPMYSQVIYDNVFTCCHSQPGKAISAGRVVRVGSVKRSISQVCNRSLKSSVFCIQ